VRGPNYEDAKLVEFIAMDRAGQDLCHCWRLRSAIDVPMVIVWPC